MNTSGRQIAVLANPRQSFRGGDKVSCLRLLVSVIIERAPGRTRKRELVSFVVFLSSVNVFVCFPQSQPPPLISLLGCCDFIQFDSHILETSLSPSSL